MSVWTLSNIFQTSAVTPRHDNKLNENHRLDSDLSTYNKLGGIRSA